MRRTHESDECRLVPGTVGRAPAAVCVNLSAGEPGPSAGRPGPDPLQDPPGRGRGGPPEELRQAPGPARVGETPRLRVPPRLLDRRPPRLDRLLRLAGL